MRAAEFPLLQSERGIAAVIRSAEIGEERERAAFHKGESPLCDSLLKRIADLQVIQPAVEEYGSLQAALQADHILRERLEAFVGTRQWMRRLKKRSAKAS